MILAHAEAGLALTGRQALARGRSQDLQAQHQHPPADVLASTASNKTDGDIHGTRRSPEGLISRPDPPDNLWTASSRRSRPGVDGQNHAEFALYNED
jgi:hypothetical protein